MDNLHQTAEKSETRLKFERKWLVLMAAFLSKGLGTGFPFNLSVLYVEWLQEFGKSNSETSLIQSVCTGVLLIGGELHIQMYNHCTPLYILFIMFSIISFFIITLFVQLYVRVGISIACEKPQRDGIISLRL